MISEFVGLYLACLAIGLPIAVVFGLANLIVNIFLTAGFSGRLDVSGRGRYL